MEKFKVNHYIEIIPVPEDEVFLVYNILNSSLDIISDTEGFMLSELSCQKNFSTESSGVDADTFNEFVEKEYIIPAEVSEIQKAESNYLSKRDLGTTIYVTITTTTICNMDCPYCFETNKPSVVLKDAALLNTIQKYIVNMIATSKKKYTSLNLTWYGGEPLINIKAIKDFTPLLLNICAEMDLYYSANMITNGIYLTKENLEILYNECLINRFQITLDGPQKIHDENRPLKAKNQENYTRILRNISNAPNNIQINIRINVDRNVADNIDELLEDLCKYQIWPHKIINVTLDPRNIILYEGAKINAQDDKYLDHREFFDFVQDFRKKKLAIYNSWRNLEGTSKAKLSWEFPETTQDCGTWGDEAGLVIDPKGNTHKCWETVHLPSKTIVSPNQMTEGFSITPYQFYIDYNRYNVKMACRMCKYISICDKISCQKQSLDNVKPPCTIWKFRTKDFIKSQYLTYVNNPELITEPS